MELLKKYIEADPYGAIFGRRLDPFHKFGKYDTSWNGFLQSFSNTERPTKTRSTDALHWQTKSDANHVGLQYDPISGRMAPMPPTASQSPNGGADLESDKGVNYPQENEVEAKFTATPSSVEDGQHQPDSQLCSESRLDSQSIAACPPDNKLEVPTPTIQTAQTKIQVPQEATNKSNASIDCSPGNELESLFISESGKSTQPQSEEFKVNNTDKKLGSDTSLISDANVECPPGSELEAKFISDPASCFDESLSSELNTQQPNASSKIDVDCPPGNELEAKFTAKFTRQDIKYDDPVHINTNPETQLNSRESFDCSPGSEIEAHMLSESAIKDNSQLEAKTFIDCPPGNELEAKFISNPASAEDGQFQPAMAANLDTAKRASINIDCSPGSELEAMFISDSAGTKGSNARKDLGALDASDTHTRLASSELKEHDHPLNFDASEDRVGDFVIQNQTAATEDGAQSSASQQSFPEFHILAFDTSTSQVLTAKADSFFGINEDTLPSEILSRLHHPAKFLPYFEKMQKDGYEIATGGGNILVFQKIHSTPRPAQNTINHDPAIHAEISKHIRHDSKDFTSSYHGASEKSTAEVSRQ